MSELIMVGQSAQVLIDEIARLQAALKAHRDMLMRLYQDTVPPSGYCYRCGLWAGAHDESCAMAELEELLALEFEGRRMTMSGMTSERLEELRRIAEAATPGPWWLDGWDIRSEDGDRFIASITDAFCGQRPDARLEELSANGYHISTFDPPTVFALLDEIERLRREREVLADVLRHVHTCENCECALCPEGAELAYSAYRAVSRSELLAGEEGVDGVTHFALYHPDLNVWECQAKDCRFQWEFMEDGNPYDDDMRFCPRCGRRIVRGRNKSTVITLKQRERH